MYRRFIIHAVIAALLAVGALLSACSLTLPSAVGTLTGSGNLATRDYAIDGFTGIDARDGFRVTVRGGDTFQVAITADDNVLDALSVRKVGDTLRLGVDRSKAQSINTTRREAVITLGPIQADLTNTLPTPAIFGQFLRRSGIRPYHPATRIQSVI
jgi:Putative auto-transporter adhesin, head GIN domain